MAGGWHTCAVVSGGAVKCWGFNGYGQLGNGVPIFFTTQQDVLGSPFNFDVFYNGFEAQ